MTTFNYANTAATADRLLKRFGARVEMSRTLPGAYDPATGGPGAGTTTTQTVTAAVFDYPQRYIDGTKILAGDRQCFLSAVGVNEPLQGDRFTWDGKSMVVVAVKKLAPAGLAVLYELQVRTP